MPTLIGDLIDTDPRQPSELVVEFAGVVQTRVMIAPTVRHDHPIGLATHSRGICFQLNPDRPGVRLEVLDDDFSTPSRVRIVVRFAFRFPILKFLFLQQSETQIEAAYGCQGSPGTPTVTSGEARKARTAGSTGPTCAATVRDFCARAAGSQFWLRYFVLNPYLATSTKVAKMNSDARVSGFEYPDEPFDPDELVTNDAVGGEPVKPTGHYAGPQGSEPLEASPEYDEHAPNSEDGPNDLDGE